MDGAERSAVAKEVPRPLGGSNGRGSNTFSRGFALEGDTHW